MRQLKLETITPFPINTPVQIVAMGGMEGDWFGAVGLTGAGITKGGVHHTVLKIISPLTGVLCQSEWRTEWLEELEEGEKIEELEKLKWAIQDSKRLAILTCSQGSAHGHLPPEKSVEFQPSSRSNGRRSAKKSSKKTNLPSLFTETLPPSERNSTRELTCSPLHLHAPHLVEPDCSTEAATNAIASPIPSELSQNVAPDSSLLKIPSVSSIAQSSQVENAVLSSNTSCLNLTNEVIAVTGQSFQQVNSDYRTTASDCLSLPTPTGLSSKRSRPPGQMKLETRLKQQGLIVRGEVANPEFLEAMMGTCVDYTLPTQKENPDSSLLPSAVATRPPVLDEKPLETASPSPVPSVSLEGSFTSIALSDELSEDERLAQKKEGNLHHNEYSTEPTDNLKQGSPLFSSLSPSEERDRIRLEKKVERAFYEAGSALREIRDRKLYRSTDKSWDAYVKRRFGYSRDSADNKILCALVLENLQSATNLPSIARQILPTSERQALALTKLEPSEQPEVWEKVVVAAGGKVPSGRMVKEITEKYLQLHKTPPVIPYVEGDVVEVRSGGSSTLRKHDGMWGIVVHVGTWHCTVHISLRNINVQCKATEMDKVPPMYIKDIESVSHRISELSKLDLDPTVWSILETLSRQTCFNQMQMDLLDWIERYSVLHSSSMYS